MNCCSLIHPPGESERKCKALATQHLMGVPLCDRHGRGVRDYMLRDILSGYDSDFDENCTPVDINPNQP